MGIVRQICIVALIFASGGPCPPPASGLHWVHVGAVGMCAQVAAVRGAMASDMTQLASIARTQAAAAADAEARLTARIAWGVRMLQRREDANAARRVLGHWRCGAPFRIPCTRVNLNFDLVLLF